MSMDTDPPVVQQDLDSLGIVVTETPKFDLDSYISNYDGYTRLERLITIGITSRPLAVDALKLAVADAKQGKNINIYLDIAAHLQRIAPAEPAATIDQDWLDRTRKQVDKETDRLESELKGYKNNLIKESIRMGNEELGAHYHATGDLALAQKAYTRMREYCTTSKHMAEMNLRLAMVHLSQRNYMLLQSAAFRVQAASLPKPDMDRFAPVLPPLLGLAALASGDYRAAAAHFLSTDPSFISATDPLAGGIVPSRAILTPNDVATYGTLSALATYDRPALRAALLDSPTFRQFLELEPHLRRAVAALVGAKYRPALAALDAYRPDYLLDPHLQAHVPALLGAVRRRAVVAYVAPFARASISAMASSFGGGPPAAMAAELADLIGAGLLDARLDAEAGELVSRGAVPSSSGTSGSAPDADAAARRRTAERALAAAAEQERAMRLRLWRVRVADAGLEIKPVRGGAAGVAMAGGAGIGPGATLVAEGAGGEGDGRGMPSRSFLGRFGMAR